jgi:prophage antirepressor-like protein
MSEIIQSFDFETKEVRIIGDTKNPWFVAKDICSILELSNVSQAVSKLPNKWKGIYLL